MDHVVRTIVWIALFGGTGAVILVTLPRVVIWCLEIVETFQKARSRKKALNTPHKSPQETPQPAPSRAQHLQAAANLVVEYGLDPLGGRGTVDRTTTRRRSATR